MPSSPQTSSLPAQQHGVLVLNKPSGPTSNRCLSALKRLGQKKIGHAGTLDPMAEGVLLLLLGRATRISNYLLEAGCKVYSATARLGLETDTWDAEGQTVAEKPWQDVRCEDVAAAISAFEGELEQMVPPYSAAKSNGQPLYKLARAGREVPVRYKTVHIFRAEVLSMDLPFVHFRVTCSSGTYIRSLAHSLGMRVGCGAALTKLTREYSHPFGLNQSVTLDELTADPAGLAGHMHPIEEALPDWPVLPVGEELAAKVRNGMSIPCPARYADAQNVLLKYRDDALALARVTENRLTIARGLWS